jgi:hypothetical protein
VARMKVLIKDLLEKVTSLEGQLNEAEASIRKLSAIGQAIEDHAANRIADYVKRRTTSDTDLVATIAKEIREGWWRK